jgi:ferredoxin-thioredoxin reductase catalytic subunit
MDEKKLEQEIRRNLDKHVASKDLIAYNPDKAIVDRVINGLVKRTIKTGSGYCPCRLVSGNDELDKKIICPCEFHEDEVEKNGECLCKLFVKNKDCK